MTLQECSRFAVKIPGLVLLKEYAVWSTDDYRALGKILDQAGDDDPLLLKKRGSGGSGNHVDDNLFPYADRGYELEPWRCRQSLKELKLRLFLQGSSLSNISSSSLSMVHICYKCGIFTQWLSTRL